MIQYTLYFSILMWLKLYNLYFLALLLHAWSSCYNDFSNPLVSSNFSLYLKSGSNSEQYNDSINRSIVCSDL